MTSKKTGKNIAREFALVIVLGIALGAGMLFDIATGQATSQEISIVSVAADNPANSAKDFIIEARDMQSANTFRIVGDWIKSSNSFKARSTNIADLSKEVIAVGFNSPS